MPSDNRTLKRTASATERQRQRFSQTLRGRDFRLLWTGEFVSLIGDQFFNVALPWLVLELSGGAFAIGAVVAVTGAPRAVFLLVGGALIDRFSPRTVMLYSNIGRMVIVAILALLTAVGLVQLWMLYASGFLLGLGYAFYLPAQSAMIPRLLPGNRLQAGNAVIQGTAQLSLFFGPVIAGVLIALLGGRGGGSAATDATGIGIVFAIDAASFLVSGATLRMIKLPSVVPGSSDPRRNGVLHSVAEGIADVWRDRTLRHYFVLIGAVNLALLGPMSVGIPILVRTRFGGGAFAFGTILSGVGAGALAGVIAGGVMPRPSGRAFAAVLLGSSALLGIGLGLIGVLPSWQLASAAGFLVGVAEGYLTVEFITWLQLRTPREELGRMMSILLFASVGQAPLSNVLAGALMRFSAPLVLVGAGGLIVFVAGIAALSRSVWRLGD
jgi:predicted membrane channel-forming protein YqfA (hemolysin III family)